MKSFKDLVVWQKAHAFVLLCYHITKKYPKDELFALTSQTRRAAVSIAANIVEGFKRRSIKESIRFYIIADASLEETKYHLLLAKDLRYITNEEYINLQNKFEEVGKLLHGWIQSQKKKT